MSFDVQSIAEIGSTSDLWLHNQMYENILKQQNLQWTWEIFAKVARGDFWGSCETQLDFHNQIAFQQSCQIFLVATWCKVWLSSANSEWVLSYNLAAIAGIQMHHSKVANHGCNVLPSELKASNIVFQCLRKSFQIFFQEILPNIVSMFEEILQQAGSPLLCNVHPERCQLRWFSVNHKILENLMKLVLDFS